MNEWVNKDILLKFLYFFTFKKEGKRLFLRPFRKSFGRFKYLGKGTLFKYWQIFAKSLTMQNILFFLSWLWL